MPDDTPTGTCVEISGFSKEFRLQGDKARVEVAEQLAIYLRQYSDTRVTYDGARVDPAALEIANHEYEIGPVSLDDGRSVSATLVIIEWSIPSERSLFLCDEDGFTYHRVAPKIQAPGFDFTAYLRSAYIRELHENNQLELDDLSEGTGRLVEAGKQALKSHFRSRSAERAVELVDGWKKRDIYPFQGEAKSPVEVAERQVFDLVALNVSEYLPSFADSDDRTQRLQLRLLRQAVEASPDVARRILSEVLELPLVKQQQLASLLDRTSLSSIISAARLVADRLDFVLGLERLVFEKNSKDQLLERSQLHKIVEKNTWIFGEQFHLTASDKSLDEVLAKHLHLLRKDAEEDGRPVQREDGSMGIVDLMLSRKVPQANPNAREHLVVELKRPRVKVSLSVHSQLQSYAFAVAKDERFRDTNTRWIFWAVSNELTDEVSQLASQQRLQPGQTYSSDNIEIWVKSWGQVVADCKARLRFFQDALQYEASDESAVKYLRDMHGEYLPPALMESSSDRVSVAESGPLTRQSRTPARRRGS